MAEIARMATGKLETTAGVELAKALLDIDFKSTGVNGLPGNLLNRKDSDINT